MMHRLRNRGLRLPRGRARFPIRSGDAALVLWLALTVAPLQAAQNGTGDDSGRMDAQQVAESLDAMGNLPWYDAERGGVEPIPVRPQIDDSVNRDSRWLAKPKAQSTTKTSNSTTATTSRSSNPNSYADLIAWVIIGVLMGLIVALLVYTFMRIEEVPAAGQAAADEESLEELQARIEKLPIDVRRPVGDLLQEADRLLEAGKIAEAIIYLFGHRLLQLDRHHAIRLARGKTNRQYLSELIGRQELQYLVRETVDMFEKSYFGRYRVEREQFEQVRSRQAEFESLLAHLREAA